MEVALVLQIPAAAKSASWSDLEVIRETLEKDLGCVDQASSRLCDYLMGEE